MLLLHSGGTRPDSQAVGTESCAAVLINDLKPREPLMNIKAALFAYAVPQVPPRPPLVRLRPMTAGEGRGEGRGPGGRGGVRVRVRVEGGSRGGERMEGEEEEVGRTGEGEV